MEQNSELTKNWINAWENGNTRFHMDRVHPLLVKYGSKYLQTDANVLVPLCGKALDLRWLAEQGFRVQGVEVSGKAIHDFFVENDIKSQREGEYRHLGETKQGEITLFEQDFFLVNPQETGTIDFVYDRAALVALPAEIRRRYAVKLREFLRLGARILLITLEYNQSEMSGPPFSVSLEEVHDLFASDFRIESLCDMDITAIDGLAKRKGLSSLKENCLLLEFVPQ